MAVTKHHVTIKGVKDGLVFIMDEECSFDVLITELKHKLEKTHQKILTGPVIHVQVKLGDRVVTDEQKDLIKSIIKQKGNLMIQSIESREVESKDERSNRLTVITGMIRSGQTVHAEGSIMFIGDVNPGGTITSTGDIYVMGCLRGLAHAGIEGKETAIIAASYMKPTQLRIAGIISRPPDEWETADFSMEFAYLKENKMEIDKVQHMHQLRPEALHFKGE